MILDGKRVLVTGGTGSLGTALVRRLLSNVCGQPENVTVFSRDEAKQHEMRLAYLQRDSATDEVIYGNAQRRLRFVIGDVRHYQSVCGVIRNADVIFNTAALKQVPTCEQYPSEAVLTNIIGTDNLIRAIRDTKYSVETVIGVSTDKAAAPVSVYGATKMIQERMLIQANAECPGTRFVCVRYGNVIASRGSVIPLFQSQIAAGGPVTITSPEMTRFLLSLDGALDTLMAVLESGNPGEVYVPRIPSAYIADVATVLINGRNVPVVVTGVRPGEKIHEVLVTGEEIYRTTWRGGFYVIQPLEPSLRTAGLGHGCMNKEYSSADSLVDITALEKMLQAWRGV